MAELCHFRSSGFFFLDIRQLFVCRMSLRRCISTSCGCAQKWRLARGVDKHPPSGAQQQMRLLTFSHPSSLRLLYLRSHPVPASQVQPVSQALEMHAALFLCAFICRLLSGLRLCVGCSVFLSSRRSFSCIHLVICTLRK